MLASLSLSPLAQWLCQWTILHSMSHCCLISLSFQFCFYFSDPSHYSPSIPHRLLTPALRRWVTCALTCSELIKCERCTLHSVSESIFIFSFLFSVTFKACEICMLLNRHCTHLWKDAITSASRRNEDCVLFVFSNSLIWVFFFFFFGLGIQSKSFPSVTRLNEIEKLAIIFCIHSEFLY